MTLMAPDVRSRSVPLPHSLVALVVLLCAATSAAVHLIAAGAASLRTGPPGLPGGLAGGLAVELPLRTVASVVGPVGTVLLGELLGMPLPDLVSPAALVLAAAGLVLAGAGPAPPTATGRVVRRGPGCRSLRPGA